MSILTSQVPRNERHLVGRKRGEEEKKGGGSEVLDEAGDDLVLVADDDADVLVAEAELVPAGDARLVLVDGV